MTCSTPLGRNSRIEGERRRDVALERLAIHREAIVRRGQRALLELLLEGRPTVNADDVRAAVELPSGVDARCLGSVPRPLATAGIITPAGYIRSCRPERHASPIQNWRLVNTLAARRWLDSHPDESLAQEERPPAGTDERSKASTTLPPGKGVEGNGQTL
jgi:hypothetical protein